MNKIIIQIITSLLVSNVQANIQIVERSDGKIGGDKAYGFGSCNEATTTTSNGWCKCNEKKTFYMDQSNTKPSCYTNEGIQNMTGCHLSYFTGDHKTFTLPTTVKNESSIAVWDVKNGSGYWKEDWTNDMKKYITLKNSNTIKIEKTDHVTFEGLLIRITVERLLTGILLGQAGQICLVVKVGGTKTHPLKLEDIIPTTKPSTVSKNAEAQSPTTQTSSTTTNIINNTSTNKSTRPTSDTNVTNTTQTLEHIGCSSSSGYIIALAITVSVAVIIIAILAFDNIRLKKRLNSDKTEDIQMKTSLLEVESSLKQDLYEDVKTAEILMDENSNDKNNDKECAKGEYENITHQDTADEAIDSQVEGNSPQVESSLYQSFYADAESSNYPDLYDDVKTPKNNIKECAAREYEIASDEDETTDSGVEGNSPQVESSLDQGLYANAESSNYQSLIGDGKTPEVHINVNVTEESNVKDSAEGHFKITL